jgi:membrane protease YdiL (CAAX protease family)
MLKKETAIKDATILTAYLLVVWGFYRFLFKLPEEIEELVVKPILWLVPIFYLIRREKAKLESVGITFKNLLPSIYLSFGLGIIFTLEALLINFVKYKGFSFSTLFSTDALFISLGLSFATAISEEIAFRGFLFTRFKAGIGKEWTANLISSLIWALINVPITIFVWKLGFSSALVYLVLTFFFGIGSAFVFARTKNILSSILLHVFWAWPIILFR